MPLTSQYLRYKDDGVVNIIASNTCNLTFIIYKGSKGRYIATGASDAVVIWDMRAGDKVCTFPGEQVAVTYLAASPSNKLAAGYSNGTIKIFDLLTNQCLCTFAGHQTAITCLTFNADGQLLASGAQDTAVIVWDTVAEKGKLRLAQHTNQITQVCFMKTLSVLISCSKDKLVKFWDLTNGHCFKTLAAHNSEIWSMALRNNDKHLVTASNDYDVYIWQLCPMQKQINPIEDTVEIVIPAFPRAENNDDYNTILSVKKMGTLLRSSKGVCHIAVSEESGHIVTFNGTDSKIEVFYFNTELEVRKKVQKKIKKWRHNAGDEPMPTASISDVVTRCPIVQCSDKMKACHLVSGTDCELRLVALLSSNMVELYNLVKTQEVAKLLQVLYKDGHRNHIDTVDFSSDSQALATGSSDSVRVWNMVSRTCIRTFDIGAVKAMCFTPGDRHLLVGDDNKLVLLDVTNSKVAEEIPAHEKQIWSIAVFPNQKGCVTGSMDHTVKFWDFTLLYSSKTSGTELSLLHYRTLYLTEGVLCTCISPNSQFIAVALTDNTVKIFFFDSLKLFHTLYGHSLPVTCMDISYDSALICTGSQDRNIKIWGMDFGDCHRSIYAHGKTISGIKFVPNTHYFFSCGGDGIVNQWDADTFERIQTLKGHTGGVLSLAVTSKYVASSGVDKVLRFWKCVPETVVLEDEREEERAQEEEAALATEPVTIVPGQASHSLPSRKTVGAEKAAEELMEALEVAAEYTAELQEYQALQAGGQTDKVPEPPLLMQAMGLSNPEKYVVAVLKKIRASDIEEALLLLRFSAMEHLIKFMPMLIKLDPFNETVLIVYAFILRVQSDLIVACPSLLSVIRQLTDLSSRGVNNQRDKLGHLVYILEVLKPADVRVVEESVLKVS